MFLTFPVLAQNAYSTAQVTIHLNYDKKVPDCKVCGMKMNEIYIIAGCKYTPDDIHIHFSHQHYDPNLTFREHYCYPAKQFYDSAK